MQTVLRVFHRTGEGGKENSSREWPHEKREVQRRRETERQRGRERSGWMLETREERKGEEEEEERTIRKDSAF